MAGVDVFGRSSKNSVSILKVLSNGGLNLITDVLGIKLDPNANNMLRLSANGLMASGVMTGNLVMNGHRVIDLDTTYPPQINSQATSWSQVKQFVTDYGNLSWDLNGNAAGVNTTFGTLDNFDIKFVRNKQDYLLFKANRILVKKNVDMSNIKVVNLKNPTDPQDAATKHYVDAMYIKNSVGYVPELLQNDFNSSGFIVSSNAEYDRHHQAYNVFSPRGEWISTINENIWIQLYCPEKIKIHKFSLRGRNAGDNLRIITWKLQGSNDGTTWNDIYADNPLIDYQFKFFNVPPPGDYYSFYRIYISTAESGNIGLMHWQLYAIDGIISD
jgi:hypothetical protein